jgi:hypothetical protein
MVVGVSNPPIRNPSNNSLMRLYWAAGPNGYVTPSPSPMPNPYIVNDCATARAAWLALGALSVNQRNIYGKSPVQEQMYPRLEAPSAIHGVCCTQSTQSTTYYNFEGISRIFVGIECSKDSRAFGRITKMYYIF